MDQTLQQSPSAAVFQDKVSLRGAGEDSRASNKGSRRFYNHGEGLIQGREHLNQLGSNSDRENE